MDEAKRKAAETEAAAAQAKAIEDATAPLKKQLTEKEEELAKLKDKDFNFNKVVKSEKEKEELLNKATEEIGNLKRQIDEVASRPVVEAKNSLLDSLSGADKTLRDKIEFQFNRLGKDSKTAVEVEANMREAYLLATGAPMKSVDAVRKFQSGGGRNNRPAPAGGTGNVDPNLKEWSSEFNKHLPKELQISDEDFKKYPIKPGQSAESEA